VPLFAPGRSHDAIAAFAFEHVHGAYRRAHVTFRYVVEEGLAYQRSLATTDAQIEHVSAPLTLEAVALLVNQRLVREGDLARVGVDDIRAAVAYATHPLVAALTVDRNGRISIERLLEADS